MLAVATADDPDAPELREIARELCALIDVTPREPIDVEQLRELVDDPKHDQAVRFAVNACADALAAYELRAEIRHLRSTLLAYLSWFSKGDALRRQLVDALSKAGPFLDDEAEARALGEAEATNQALTDEQRADGYRVKLWPSPETLGTLPREVSVLLQQEGRMLARLSKVLGDLANLDASPEVISSFIPVKTRIAKMLAAGGYEVPEITTVTEPHAKSGPERRQAQNTVWRRVKSARGERLYTRKVDPSLPNAAALAAAREEAARFVAGVGRNVVILAPERTLDPKRRYQ